jgi:hypothetical protein
MSSRGEKAERIAKKEQGGKGREEEGDKERWGINRES